MPGSPSIVPQDADHDMYIILDAFGAWVGRAWGETEDICRETVIGLRAGARLPARIFGDCPPTLNHPCTLSTTWYSRANGSARSVSSTVATRWPLPLLALF
jgi:hypothetical protein